MVHDKNTISHRCMHRDGGSWDFLGGALILTGEVFSYYGRKKEKKE